MNTETVAESDSEDDDDGPDRTGLIVSAGILAVFIALLAMGGGHPSSSLAVPCLIAQVAVISVVIWQVCDPFADAAQWIGETFRLPGSVRGATLDAIASSMPELFSGIFFVVVARLRYRPVPRPRPNELRPVRKGMGRRSPPARAVRSTT